MKHVKNISLEDTNAVVPVKAQAGDDIFGDITDFLKGLLSKGEA